MFSGPTIMLADGATPPIFFTKTETTETLSQLPAIFFCLFLFSTDSNRMSNYIYNFFFFLFGHRFANFLLSVFGISYSWLLLLSGVNEIGSEKCRPGWKAHWTVTCKHFLKWFDHAARSQPITSMEEEELHVEELKLIHWKAKTWSARAARATQRCLFFLIKKM